MPRQPATSTRRPSGGCGAPMSRTRRRHRCGAPPGARAPEVGQITVVIEGFDPPGLDLAASTWGPGQHDVQVALTGPGKESHGTAGTGEDRPALVVPGGPLPAFEPVPADATSARWEVNVRLVDIEPQLIKEAMRPVTGSSPGPG